jgi:hypothetical protein
VRADVRRRRQRLEDLLRHRGRVARLRHLGEQDDEFVAAVPAHRVRFAHRRLEAARRQLQTRSPTAWPSESLICLK